MYFINKQDNALIDQLHLKWDQPIRSIKGKGSELNGDVYATARKRTLFG